jgi:D-arabinan exo alpha-(1,3)/(1,5)-arabinofuranosidase (non-reducing end)
MLSAILLCLTLGPATAAPTTVPFYGALGLPQPVGVQRVTQLIGLQPGQDHAFTDVEGPGCITHIWMTIAENDPRRIVLRMYWDNEEEPSVEAPLSDFFGIGHGEREPAEPFTTACIVVAPSNGYNCYLPMPFRKRARIVIQNDQDVPLHSGGGVYFQADYLEFDALPEETMSFHAQWRRESPAARRTHPYTILQAVGEGLLAGVTYHVRTDDPSDIWVHGGGDYVFTDGSTRPRVLKGIGGEDFFGESWNARPFLAPHAGCHLNVDGRVSMYRFFLEGAPRFYESLWFGFGSLANEITSVAYWYQREPHTRFVDLPDIAQRAPDSALPSGALDHELMSDAQLDVAVIGPFAGSVDTVAPLETVAQVDLTTGLITNYEKFFRFSTVNDLERRVRWERTRTTLGWLDLEGIYKPKHELVQGVQAMPGAFVYALLRVTATRDTSVMLRIGHDDPVRVWVNGEQAGDLRGANTFTLGEVELPLITGPNDVLIKITNTWNSNFAAFAASLSLDEGDRSGVTFDDFAALPSAIEPWGEIVSLEQLPEETGE